MSSCWIKRKQTKYLVKRPYREDEIMNAVGRTVNVYAVKINIGNKHAKWKRRRWNSAVMCAFSAWQKWAEIREVNALPTSGPEFSLYLVLQSTKSLASIQAATFEVAWAHQKACLPSPWQHAMVKQLLKTCKIILGTGPKKITETTPYSGPSWGSSAPEPQPASDSVPYLPWFCSIHALG